MARVTEIEAGVGALADYGDWFEGAREGDMVVYHRGDLQFDRDAANIPDPTDADRQRASAVDGMAKAVMRDVEGGYLLPSQQRIAAGVFAYRATRRLSAVERLTRTRAQDAARV